MNILLLQNLISQQQKILLEDQHAEIQQAKVITANFVKKPDFDDKLKNLNKKVTSNVTKPLLVENELKKLQTLDSSLLISQG